MVCVVWTVCSPSSGLLLLPSLDVCGDGELGVCWQSHVHGRLLNNSVRAALDPDVPQEHAWGACECLAEMADMGEAAPPVSLAL